MKATTSPKYPAVESAPVEVPRPHLDKILVPVDFLESSRRALVYAVELAVRFGSELTLLHVIQPAIPPAPDYGVGESLSATVRLQELATEQLAKWLDGIKPSIDADSKIEIGAPHREIVRLAREERADLIVIGMRGHSGLEHFLFGSTAEHVVRHAFCPVTVVKDPPALVPLETNQHRAEAPLPLESQPVLT